MTEAEFVKIAGRQPNDLERRVNGINPVNPDDAWGAFFKQFGDWRVMLGFYEMRESVSVEELYQAFKARMSAEEQDDE